MTGTVDWVRMAKILTAILLLPVCLGAGETIVQLVRATGHADTVWVAMLAGAACWLAIYLTLPKPMWAYVLGHELTHVLWTWLFGGSVRRFKVSSNGGHVLVTRSNFLVALAPYFFPIYAVGVILLFVVGDWTWGWEAYMAPFHLLLGAAYAFHLSLTWDILQTRQSDIVAHGYLFSAVIIWLGNAAVLILGIPLLTARVNLMTAMEWCWLNTRAVLEQARALL